jgi:hypothetical protein
MRRLIALPRLSSFVPIDFVSIFHVTNYYVLHAKCQCILARSLAELVSVYQYVVHAAIEKENECAELGECSRSR